MFTYDPTTVATSPLSFVRLQIGDTDPTDVLLDDDEITPLLAAEPTAFAAATAAEMIAAKFTRRVDKQVGKLRLNSTQRAQAYFTLATRLRAQAARGPLTPYAGGQSIDEKEGLVEDDDRVEPSFTVDTMEPANVQPRLEPNWG
jgi:hypothetical protein